MCFSATASFTAATLLIPAGVASVYKAYQTDRRYLALCALPFLFGLQQLFEGLVWIGGQSHDMTTIGRYALAYMFFSWLAWPVWVPVSTYFLEPASRKPYYLGFIILGSFLGAGQYLPYFVHHGWLTVTFLPHAIVYGGVELFDFIMMRQITYVIYSFVVVLPLLLCTQPEAKIFGLLVAVVLVVTYVFFSFAYISVFCFGGALMSLYLVAMIFKNGKSNQVNNISTRSSQRLKIS
jgi:hypothetical protein